MCCFVHSMCKRRCGRNASVTACPAHALLRPAGWGYPAFALWATRWRTASTAHRGSWCQTLTWSRLRSGTKRRRTECRGETDIDSNCGLTIQTINHRGWRTWFTWSHRRVSAKRIRDWASPEHTGAPVTILVSVWTAATSCVAAEGIGLRPCSWWSDVTAPFTGAARSSANFAAQKKWCTRVYRLGRWRRSDQWEKL